MRELAMAHMDVLSKYTTIDMDRVQNHVYLHEFDKEIQCVPSMRAFMPLC